MSTFVDLYVRGEVELDDIDQFIEFWHTNRLETRPLHEFLGMSIEEYSKWVADPSVLRVLRLVPLKRQRKSKNVE